MDFYLRLTPAEVRREALNILAEKELQKQPCVRFELLKIIAHQSATTAPEKARFLIAQTAYLKTLENAPERQKIYLKSLSEDPQAVRSGFTAWDQSIRTVLADPDLWSFYQQEKRTQPHPFWLDETLLAIVQVKKDGQDLVHSPELIREIVSTARQHGPIARQIVRDLNLGAEGMLLLLQYGPLIERAVHEQLDLQEVLEILYANPGEFDQGEPSELALQLKEIYSKKPVVWRAARCFPLCWKLNREYPMEASRLLEQFAIDDIASFLYLYYPDQMPEAIAALRSTGDAAWGTLKYFAELKSDNREIFKEILKKQGWRVVPYLLKNGESGLQRLRENPDDTRWLDKDFDSEGNIVNQGWAAELPIISGPFLALRHGINGTLDWDEAGWAALDLSEAAALVGTSGVSLIWSGAKNSAKIGAKQVLKRVQSQQAREFLLKEARSMASKPSISRSAQRQTFREKALPSLFSRSSTQATFQKYVISRGSRLVSQNNRNSLQKSFEKIKASVRKIDEKISQLKDPNKNRGAFGPNDPTFQENLPHNLPHNEQFVSYLKNPDSLSVLQDQLFEVALLSRWDSDLEHIQQEQDSTDCLDLDSKKLAEEMASFWRPSPASTTSRPASKVFLRIAAGASLIALVVLLVTGKNRFRRSKISWLVGIGNLVILGFCLLEYWNPHLRSVTATEQALARLSDDQVCWEQRLSEVLDTPDEALQQERNRLVNSLLEDFHKQLTEGSGLTDLKNKEESLRVLKPFFPLHARVQLEDLIVQASQKREEKDLQKVKVEFDSRLAPFKESAQRFLKEHPNSSSKAQVLGWINERIGKDIRELKLKIQQIDSSTPTGIAERLSELSKLRDQLSPQDPERARIAAAIKVAHRLATEEEFTIVLHNSGEFRVAEFHRVVVYSGDDIVFDQKGSHRVQIQDWQEEFKLRWQYDKPIRIQIRLGSTVIFSTSFCAEKTESGGLSILALNGKRELESKSHRFTGTPYVTFEIKDFTAEEEQAFRTYILSNEW
ncbi:hypothetical protein KIH39_15615 [Telmatocola sphagniphila]|uniref:Uncharacterized protein n=1 Tax=Telmatocola sphagniphila TaxID=1123043 RepID=A0A8E6B2V3_9BACT|nr:hypothetical protein [Telmatocola sphagniphila]QVL30279.1 hypothetical protein KIH39_15615 [Telmatocola sphagniphila]